MIGHIPDFLPEQFGKNILIKKWEEKHFHWETLSHEAFGKMLLEGTWQWMFDAGWGQVDNTPEGVALRIEYVLDYGAPPPFATEEWLEDYWTTKNHTKVRQLLKQWNLSGETDVKGMDDYE